MMRKVVLLYNPDSGGRRVRRQAELESVLKLLRGAGVEAELVQSQSRAEAREHARKAVSGGCDTVFVCGGDGTIHNVVQALAKSPVALAVLPMGTANALAHDLGIPRNAMQAAETALHGVPRRVALGQVQYLNFKGELGSRYFIVTAGVGADAHLFYKLHAGSKQQLGMTAYYAKAWMLWLSYRMRRFSVEYEDLCSGELRTAEATEMMAVRIRNFGGVVRELAPGAGLERDDLRLLVCKTASRLTYLAYATRGVLRQRWAIPSVDLVNSVKVSCQYIVSPDNESISNAGSQKKVYVEADGELLGTLPVEMTIVPDALTLLAPSK